MPGEDKPPQQTRQRKKNKKSRSKGKSPGGSPSAHLGGTIDGQDDLLLPPVLQPPPKKAAEEKRKVPVAKVEEESSIAICLQVLFPYLLAGMGMVMAGMVLNNVQVSETGFETVLHKFQSLLMSRYCARKYTSWIVEMSFYIFDNL